MKKLIMTLLLMMISYAAHGLYLQTCYNNGFAGNAVSFSYQNCVNQNFSQLKREIPNSFISYCRNSGALVDYFYTNCIADNFRALERQLSGPLYLRYCTNSNSETLGYFYRACVKDNFSSLQRHLQQID